MSDSNIRLLLDENMDVEVATQLARRGIDAATVRDSGRLGGDDLALLQYATEEGRVLCTFDTDFVQLAKIDIEHAGIVFVGRKKRGIGVLVRELAQLIENRSADKMRNRLVYL